jgi:hypothetical protein
VLLAQQLLKLGAHLFNLLALLHVNNLTRKRSYEAGSKRKKQGGEERKNLKNSVWLFVWHGKQEMPVARARVS